MGGAVGGKGFVGIGAVKETIGGIPGAINLDSGGVGPILQSVVWSLNSTLTQLEQAGKGGSAGGAAGQQLLKSFQSDLTRLAYIAALQKAMLKAKGTGPFNLEKAIADSRIALDGIRKGQQPTNPQVQSAGDLIQSLSTMMKQMYDTAGAAIQNMR